MLTYIESKSAHGTVLVPLETRLLSEGMVMLEGEITPETACDCIKKLLYLTPAGGGKPIRLLINSPGGEINSGLLLYDSIQTSPIPISTICMGRAFSMAAVIFSAGTGGRYMLPHSELMLHEPLVGSRIGGSSSSIKSISDSLLETKNMLNGILVRHSTMTIGEVDDVTSSDHYLSVQEAMRRGLCDGVIGMERLVGNWEEVRDESR